MLFSTNIHKLWAILTPGQRRSVVILFILMLIGMGLETLGIGLVIPALALMIENDMAARFPFLAPILHSLGDPSREQLDIIGMLTLAGVYTVKSFFLTFLIYRQTKFVYNVRADLSLRLFTGYLRQPYTFHLQRNSAQLIRNATTEVTLLASNGLTLGLVFLTEILVLLGISVLLLTVEPLGALMVVTMTGLAGWGFHRLTRKRILRWGEARQLHEGLRIQHLQQGLGGVKDIKLLGREEDFLNQYRLHNTGSARVEQRQQILMQIPRLWFELLAVAGLATLVLVMIMQGKPMGAMIPTLGLFAAAAFRLIPSTNRVLSAVQNMRYALPVIDTLHGELNLLEKANKPQRSQLLPIRTELKLEGVSFSYPSANAPSLYEVSMKIPFGVSVGFIGGSGAGKSTLVDIILGLLTPDSGTIRVDGRDIQENVRGWQDQLGYVPQSIFLTDDTLRRNIALGLPDGQIDDAALWHAVRVAQLDTFINDLPRGLNTLVGERGVRLSGGQRQRIGIARALYHDPPVLVLDEATNSLDITTEKSVMEAVRALHGSKTILIVAHRLSAVEHCDRLYRLKHGRVVPNEVS